MGAQNIKPTEQLKEEHVFIRSCLMVLEKICEKLESGKEIDTRHLGQIIQFTKIFADKYHNGKEEKMLFPALEETGMQKDTGLIRVILSEHDSSRRYAKGLSEAAVEYQEGRPGASSKIIENARGYIGLLDKHIEKEDNGLFLIADACLAEKKQKELLMKFDTLNKIKVLVEMHEELWRALYQLKMVYLDHMLVNTRKNTYHSVGTLTMTNRQL
ncbi:MAG: hemerythrin domain-containing protein [Syntrophorhabdaceae bacterium]|nr:hemerythrin domain-containing protein [Syntrophorhabdaceae bacterium]MDD5243451.1 hemerythrin domain-containing protein [Syntrophorhabdaceae bacterium]